MLKWFEFLRQWTDEKWSRDETLYLYTLKMYELFIWNAKLLLRILILRSFDNMFKIIQSEHVLVYYRFLLSNSVNPFSDMVALLFRKQTNVYTDSYKPLNLDI